MSVSISELKEGKVYLLDGIKYRFVRMRICAYAMNENRVPVFQQLNDDGSDYIEYCKNSIMVHDWGIRIINNRLNEMTATWIKELKNFFVI